MGRPLRPLGLVKYEKTANHGNYVIHSPVRLSGLRFQKHMCILIAHLPLMFEYPVR